MTRYLPRLLVYIIILSTFLQPRQIHCLRRLMRRKLSAEDITNEMTAEDIRDLVSSSLASSNPRIIDNKKRDTSRNQADDAASFDTLAEENVAAESKDNSIYDDEVDEDDGSQQLLQQQFEDSEYKRSLDASSASDLSEGSMDQSDLAAYDEPDAKVTKDVSKREAKSEDDYDEDIDLDANLQEASPLADRKSPRSALPESNEEPRKRETPMEVSAEEDSDLDYEKQIEDQIQQRIDSIKEDIKREIERKQRIREIEVNNAKYDQLEFNRETGDLDNGEVADDPASSKRSISRDAAAASNDAGKVEGADSSMRTKRSGLSDLSEVIKSENKDTPLVVPVKKRSLVRHVTLVEKRDLGDAKTRQNRSASILIPERGHAEVKDELPGDLTLDPNLRIARSDEEENIAGDTRSGRYRRDMSDELENEKEVNDEVDEPNNFLFPAREKPDCRMRRRRSRSRNRMRSADRRKTRKRPRHSRRHRAVRASSADDEELDEEERDKRDMSIDEDAALEYKESFGGFQSESEGAGRFKRIKRSAKIS